MVSPKHPLYPHTEREKPGNFCRHGSGCCSRKRCTNSIIIINPNKDTFLVGSLYDGTEQSPQCHMLAVCYSLLLPSNAIIMVKSFHFSRYIQLIISIESERSSCFFFLPFCLIWFFAIKYADLLCARWLYVFSTLGSLTCHYYARRAWKKSTKKKP